MSITIKWLNEALENKYHLNEAKEDRQKFVNFAGADLADRFDKLKQDNKIKGEESGYYYWMKKPLDELKDFIGQNEKTTTKGEVRRMNKHGAVPLADVDGWHKQYPEDEADYFRV